MTNSEITAAFKEACNDLNIDYHEGENGDIAFKLRKSSSEGPHRFEGYSFKNEHRGDIVFVIKSPFTEYNGKDLNEAIAVLKTGKIFFNQQVEM